MAENYPTATSERWREERDGREGRERMRQEQARRMRRGRAAGPGRPRRRNSRPPCAEPSVGVMELREAIYESLFGECALVSHETTAATPHIDVYIYPPGHDSRDFYTLVTGGMSDAPMRLPQGIGQEAARAELVLYVSEPTPEYIELLRAFAHYPHDCRTWLGPGHTVPNGDPPAPFFPGSSLTTMLFLEPVLSPDDSLAELLHLEHDPLRLLWPVPISTSECRVKQECGLGALLQLFDRMDHPVVVNPRRASYL